MVIRLRCNQIDREETKLRTDGAEYENIFKNYYFRNSRIDFSVGVLCVVLSCGQRPVEPTQAE